MKGSWLIFLLGAVCFSAFVAAVQESKTSSPPLRIIAQVDDASIPVNDTDGLPCIPVSSGVDGRNSIALVAFRCQNGTLAGRRPVNETTVLVRSVLYILNISSEPSTVISRTQLDEGIVAVTATAQILAFNPAVISSQLPTPAGSPQAGNAVFVVLFRATARSFSIATGGAITGPTATITLPSATFFAEASTVGRSEEWFIVSTSVGIHKFSLPAGTPLGEILFQNAPVTGVAVTYDPDENRIFAAASNGRFYVGTPSGTNNVLAAEGQGTTYSVADLGVPVSIFFNHYVPPPGNIVVFTENIVNLQRRVYAWKCVPRQGGAADCDFAGKYQFDKEYILRSTVSPAVFPPRPAGSTGVYASAQDWNSVVYLLDDEESCLGFNVTAMTQNEIYRSDAYLPEGYSNFAPSQLRAVIPSNGELRVWAVSRDFTGNGTASIHNFSLRPPLDIWYPANYRGADTRNPIDPSLAGIIAGIVFAALMVIVVVGVVVFILYRRRKAAAAGGADGGATPRASTRNTRATSMSSDTSNAVDLEESEK